MDQKKSLGEPGEARREDDAGEKDSVTESQLREQRKILEAFGTFDFDPEYDYKAARRKKRS
jgi:hypothetical protein